MKIEEYLAQQYLLSKGYKDLIFEPDGNCTPDFVVEGNIAIEVRRLNIYVAEEAIEKLQYKIHPFLNKIINNIRKSDYNHSAYLSIYYKRPLTVSKELSGKISEVLRNHIRHLDEAKGYIIQDNFKIQIFPTEEKFDTVYHIGSILDHDRSYFVVSKLYDNLKLILKEKEKKIRPHKNKYGTWWLVLVDNIGYGMTDYDIMQFKELPSIETVFEKVILIPPSEPKRGIVIIG